MTQTLLTWDGFDRAVSLLAASLEGRSFTGIYGFPRGGLPLAVALSHRLDLPLLPDITTGCLVVDDICDSGRTLLSAMKHQPAGFAVWVAKSFPDGLDLIAATLDESESWIVFPWELPSNASTDEQLYRASR